MRSTLMDLLEAAEASNALIGDPFKREGRCATDGSIDPVLRVPKVNCFANFRRFMEWSFLPISTTGIIPVCSISHIRPEKPQTRQLRGTDNHLEGLPSLSREG